MAELGMPQLRHWRISPFGRQFMNPDVLKIIQVIEDRRQLGADNDPEEFVAIPEERSREIYRNQNDKLGIDFSVDALEFPETQVFDARIVKIAPSCNNELHKHAHESLFYIINGKAEIRIGKNCVNLNSGGIAFVPRWIFHQSKNLSHTEELIILAITDFGLTKAVLGDYDKRTRLAVGGVDVLEHA
jgi:quercetin dioxygenase-like cupin family protein